MPETDDSTDVAVEESADDSSDATSPATSVPAPPTGLRAARYSGFAGGIAWDGRT